MLSRDAFERAFAAGPQWWRRRWWQRLPASKELNLCLFWWSQWQLLKLSLEWWHSRRRLSNHTHLLNDHHHYRNYHEVLHQNWLCQNQSYLLSANDQWSPFNDEKMHDMIRDFVSITSLVTRSWESCDPRIYRWSKSKDFWKWNPRIFGITWSWSW